MADHHVCPVWVGYLLASPLRKLFQNPYKILAPYISPGMTVVDVGSAMGFFSIPMAEMTGPDGRVICVDIQQKMLDKLMQRAGKAGVDDRIEPCLSNAESLGLDGFGRSADFVLASAVVHEVPSQKAFFCELAASLKPDGKLLVVEPSGHVNSRAFEETLAVARKEGFTVADRPPAKRNHAALLHLT